MGRNKLEVRKIEEPSRRQVIYSKRHKGLIKKAYELSILCDVDIGLIMFSPAGKLSMFAKDDKIENLIGRFANTPQEERTKRRFENMEHIHMVVQQLNGTRCTTPRVRYADLLQENQVLQDMVKTMTQEKMSLEDGAKYNLSRSISSNIQVADFNSIQNLTILRQKLSDALQKVDGRISQVQQEVETSNVYNLAHCYSSTDSFAASSSRSFPWNTSMGDVQAGSSSLGKGPNVTTSSGGYNQANSSVHGFAASSLSAFGLNASMEDAQAGLSTLGQGPNVTTSSGGYNQANSSVYPFAASSSSLFGLNTSMGDAPVGLSTLGQGPNVTTSSGGYNQANSSVDPLAAPSSSSFGLNPSMWDAQVGPSSFAEGPNVGIGSGGTNNRRLASGVQNQQPQTMRRVPTHWGAQQVDNENNLNSQVGQGPETSGASQWNVHPQLHQQQPPGAPLG